ncbi:hypothetical protein Ddye_023890 [Dipteronia dyeriana]|uniref:Pentatricopeptide repeat-containing protein n=1 Tax=Dipteronia dyeriana TaxID=168575 RepID=A0AAD9TTT5_9ROSI|nr:hypothetical protein Ddye_023890 [Dipteronia dyeriana]
MDQMSMPALIGKDTFIIVEYPIRTNMLESCRYLVKETEEYLDSHGLKNSIYSASAGDIKEDLFGKLVPSPFQSCILEYDDASKGNPGQASAEAILCAEDAFIGLWVTIQAASYSHFSPTAQQPSPTLHTSFVARQTLFWRHPIFFQEMSSLVSLNNDTKLIQAICAVVLKGHWTKLSKPEIASSLTSTNIHQVLLNFLLNCDNPSLSWGFFKWTESTLPNHKNSLQSSWVMIHILTKHKYLMTAQNLLHKFALRDFLSTTSVLNSLLKVHDDSDGNSHILSWLVIFYANLKMTQDAIQVFNQMRVHSLKPHLHACTVLLNLLVKDRLTDMVWKLYKKMLGLGVVPNIHVYNVLIHACSKSGDVERVEKLLSEMELKWVKLDLVTYNTLIALYCKKGMHYEALSVQDSMETKGVSPDIVTYNSLIHGFCREGRMREAVRLFRDIKGASPNHVTYTTLIDGYCRANDLEEALRLLELMVAKGLYPGVVTYNSILRKLCEEGRLRGANKLLNEMSEKKVEPDNVTCNTLINAYCKIGDMKSAMKVKNKMLEAGLKLDRFTYKGLIHGFCKEQEMDNAKELLFSMLGAGFSPSYCTYSWLVDGYSNQGNEETVTKLLNEFVRRGHCVDVSVYRALIRRFCKKEKVDFAERVFGLMQGNGISGDSVIYTSLAYAYWKAGNANAASNMLEEMYKRRLMVTLKIYKCFNASYANDNMLGLFWNHVVERGLISKNIQKEMQQLDSYK